MPLYDAMLDEDRSPLGVAQFLQTLSKGLFIAGHVPLPQHADPGSFAGDCAPEVNGAMRRPRARRTRSPLVWQVMMVSLQVSEGIVSPRMLGRECRWVERGCQGEWCDTPRSR
jgi:hypothetical protein